MVSFVVNKIIIIIITIIIIIIIIIITNLSTTESTFSRHLLSGHAMIECHTVGWLTRHKAVDHPMLYIISYESAYYSRYKLHCYIPRLSLNRQLNRDCHWLILGHVALTKIKCIPIMIHEAMYPARDTLQHVIKAWWKVA